MRLKIFSKFIVGFYIANILNIFLSCQALAQVSFATPEELGIRPVKLYADPTPSDFRIPAPLEQMARARQASKQVQVNIIYLGPGQGMIGDNAIEWPSEAKTAFTYAAEIWGSLLDSNVPITIKACWADNLGSGVLGHAMSLSYARDFSGAPKNETWYQASLANTLAGTDLKPEEADMYIAYSSIFPWYFGTDGKCPSNKWDLVSVAAHEICHGLGFTGSMRYSGGIGSWGSGTPYPFAYDHFTQNGAGKSLIKDFSNNSAELGSQLISGDLFFSGTNTNAAYGNKPAPIYAPSSWSSGSSYSHLDEVFNGTKDALMTFSIANGESIHNVGPVTRGILKDLGWKISGGSGGKVLEVSPLQLAQTCQKGQNASSQSFFVWNSGDSEMEFSISGGAQWVSCTPNSGKSTGSTDKVLITVNYNSSNLDIGTYNATFTVSSQGAKNSPQTVNVALTVIQRAEISLDKKEINVFCSLGTDAAIEKFTVSNAQTDTTLSYKVSDNVEWMHCSPSSGIIQDTETKDEIEILFDTKNLPIGNYQGFINISAPNTSNSPQTIAVNLTVGDTNIIPSGDTQVAAMFSDAPNSVLIDALNRVNSWCNSSSNKVNLIQNSTAKLPILLNAFKGLPILYFNGSSSLEMPSSFQINSGGPYFAKTVILYLRTSDDVSKRQVIFEQGDSKRGFNIYIDSGLIYFSAWNRKDDAGEGTAWGPVFTYAPIDPNTNYAISFVLDATSRTLSAYLNGVSVEGKTGVREIFASKESVSIGGVKGSTLFHDLKKSAPGFKGYIGAFLYYNQTLSIQQIARLSDYLSNKYKNNFNELDNYALWLDAGKAVIYMNDSRFVKAWFNTATKDRKLRFSQNSKNKQPLYPIAGDYQSLLFNGLENLMQSNASEQLNSSKTPYSAKTLLVKFKTSENVTSRQIIWAQGDTETGINIYLYNGNIYLGAWDKSGKAGAIWSPVFLDAPVAPLTMYCGTLVLDSQNNTMEAFLDNVSIGKISDVGYLSKHPSATIGGSIKDINFADGAYKGSFFKGSIYQAIMYNAVLNNQDRDYLINYFSGLISSIEINVPKNEDGNYAISVSVNKGQNPSSLTFYVWDSFPYGELNFTTTTNAAWCSCSPESATSTGENDKIPVVISFDATQMQPGAYTATIQISAQNAVNSPISIFLTLTIVP